MIRAILGQQHTASCIFLEKSALSFWQLPPAKHMAAALPCESYCCFLRKCFFFPFRLSLNQPFVSWPLVGLVFPKILTMFSKLLTVFFSINFSITFIWAKAVISFSVSSFSRLNGVFRPKKFYIKNSLKNLNKSILLYLRNERTVSCRVFASWHFSRIVNQLVE